jgi:hypothetical protein
VLLFGPGLSRVLATGEVQPLRPSAQTLEVER